MSLIKLCFVVDTLANHGAERFLFEILKTIDKTRFECVVYSTKSLKGFECHYEKPINELGISIIQYKEDLYPNIKWKLLKRIATSFTYRLLSKKVKIDDKIKESKLNYLRSFDRVVLIKWEVYTANREVYDRLDSKVIHVLSTKNQYTSSPFTIIPKGKTAISVMSKNELLYVFPEYQDRTCYLDYSFHTLPLLINDSVFTESYNPNMETLRIGIFSRISPDQPTLFALYLVHLLKYRNVDIELFFFGKHKDESIFNFYNQQCANLRIADRVKFMGHTFDMAKSIYDNQLTLGVMNCDNDLIGYSSIELIGHGLPVLFYNFNDLDYQNTDSNILPVFNSIDKMAMYIQDLNGDKENLKAMNKNQRAYLLENYSAKTQIGRFENIYASI